jgi:hypothetical protein
MGMDGVMYGYVVSKLRKPKKDFCLSIGMNCSSVWRDYERYNILYNYIFNNSYIAIGNSFIYSRNKKKGLNTRILKRITELSVRQLVTSATRCLKLVVVDT